jgi:hypothetical protein
MCSVGGTVSGLEGDEVVLQNNGGDDQVVTTDGGFTFSPQDDGTDYEVTVATQPTDPSQTCSVANGTGTLAGADVDDIEVTCTTDQFTVGGTVSGLAGNEVVLQNNGGDDLVVSANGGFTFSPQDDGTDYEATVATLPTNPSQTCSVANGTGTLAGADVTDVEVTCTTDQFTVGGTVSGLEGDEVVLQNNGGDDLAVAANGSFTFATALDDLSSYDVTVATQPDGQFCSAANASGTLAGDDVDDVAVDCVDIELGLSLSEIDFPELVLGQDEAQSLMLTNTGSADVVIQAFDMPAAPFAVDQGDCTPLPLTLAPGESCSLTLSFEPYQAGSFEDQLDVVSNAASSPDSVTLRGGALEPLPVPVMAWPAVVVLILMMLAVAGNPRFRSVR